MNTTKLMGLALASAMAAACGGSAADDLAGIYEVSRHTLNVDNCDAEGDAVDEFPFFRLVNDEFFGEEFVSFGGCDAADDAACEDGSLFSGFFEIDGELVLRVSSSSGGGAVGCSLGLLEGVILDQGDGSVVIETRTFSDFDDTLSEAECEPEEAEARGDSMPCDQLEVVAGTLVE